MRNPRKEVGRKFNELVDYSQIVNTPGGGGSGTVTSVDMTVPTELTISGNPITSSGTLAISLTTGYLIPTTASKTDWDSAFNDKIVSASVTGTTTKTLTLTQQDAGTITASWTDATGSGTVTSVAMTVPTGLTITGSPITTSGTLALTLTTGYSIPTTVSQTNWDTAYTNRITSLTTTGSSGSATLVSNTLNIPTYTLAGLGGFANPMTTLGDVIYGAASGTPTRLAGNTTAVKQYLSQTGTGTVSAAPVWSAIAGSDVTGAALTKTDDTNVTLTLGGTPTTALLRAASITVGWTGTLADARIASAATWNAKENALTFSAPLSRATNTISIPVATALVDGYLSSANFTTFNNKQAAITLTTTGSSGSATFVTNTLNIPTYTLAGLGGISLTSLSSTATGLTYTNTTGVFSLTTGYAIPTTTSQTNWDTAYTNRITSLTTTGSSGAATLTTNTLNIPNYTLAGLGGVSSNIYTADGTLASVRTITQGANLLTFSASRTSGNSVTVSSTQTAINTTDTGDGALFVNYTLTSTTASTIQLVSRAFSFTATNNITGTGSSITNLRVIDVQGKTNATTTTTNLDLLYILGASATGGTVTTGRGIYIRNMQGTSQGGLVIDTFSGTNNTYLALGTSAGTLATGSWGIYQADTTFNNYFAGKVLVGTATASTYEVDVVGDIRANTYTALAGTASLTPLILTLSSAVLNTTAVAGGFEVDTIGVPYYSYAASSRGVNVVSQFISLTTAYTLTSQTAAQKMFNTSTNGALTVQAGTTYIFDCDFNIGSMSATSGTFGFAIVLGGGASVTSIQWISQAGKSATPATPFGLENTFNTTAANTTLTTASTVTQGAARIQGIIRINVGGTITPSVSLTVAAAAVVGANSRFSLYPIGTNTVTRTGNWS